MAQKIVAIPVGPVVWLDPYGEWGGRKAPLCHVRLAVTPVSSGEQNSPGKPSNKAGRSRSLVKEPRGAQIKRDARGDAGTRGRIPSRFLSMLPKPTLGPLTTTEEARC